jgi:succinate dehydrogenase / fumarate reductase iron-sulfur subunit
MNYKLKIKRQKEKDGESYWQSINYTCADEENETVATVLNKLADGEDPVVMDLIVDRSIMREDLKKMRVWMESEAVVHGEKKAERMYDASRCLQCGCCLEVCPNFCAGDQFFGAAAAVPTARILQAGGKTGYEDHFYKGCGKSLACRDICPAKIDMDKTLSLANALAVWRVQR